MTFRDYSVFGLRVRSEIPLPELFEADAGDADVTIRLGAVGVPETERGLHPIAGDLLFVEPDVGRYRIAGGSEILVEANPGVPERNVRLFLLGSAFGALLHQRGLLPLHANAVEIDGRVAAFMGPSGEGKSTLAAAFHDRGHRILADDVCVVDLESGERPMVRPGLPRLRLWKDSIEQSGRDASNFDRSYAGIETFDKYDVPVPVPVTADGHVALPLAAVYLLGRADQLTIERLDGVEAAEAIFANTYRGTFVLPAGASQAHWRASLKLLEYVPLYRLDRTRQFANFSSEVEDVLAHVRSVIAGPDPGHA